MEEEEQNQKLTQGLPYWLQQHVLMATAGLAKLQAVEAAQVREQTQQKRKLPQMLQVEVLLGAAPRILYAKSGWGSLQSTVLGKVCEKELKQMLPCWLHQPLLTVARVTELQAVEAGWVQHCSHHHLLLAIFSLYSER
jgi:hypothetical protein